MWARVGIFCLALAFGTNCASLWAQSEGATPGGTERMRRLEWEKIKLDDGAYESAGVFDVNNDGKPDIVCGAYWYEAPDWKKHKICDVRAEGEYYDDFSTIPLDVNGDGYTDFITGGWWGGKLYWRENPQGKPVEWKTHEIAEVGSIETTRAWDVDGDGEPEICPNTPGAPLAFYKLDKATGRFTKHQVQKEGGSGHGLGFGEVVPGKKGFVVTNGWWEAPADPLRGEWTFHQGFELGSASVPILVVDVNGDGKNELVVGQAHGYGLDYYTREEKDDPPRRTWTKHPIDPWFSQYHELQWVDVDGDGRNEIVTGNRFRAHCGKEPGETDVAGLYYFKWNGESFTKCVIDHGKKGEASGTGIFMWIGDLFGSGRMDVVAPGKEGLYVFKNLGPEKVGAK